MVALTPTEARIVHYAETLLLQHKLYGWTVSLDRSVRRAGACIYTTKTVSLSKALIKARPIEDSLNTVRHEVAHALAGHRAGHGPTWQRICRDLGGDGQRLYNSASVDREKLQLRYSASCPNCGHTAHYSRKLASRRSCGKCDPRKFNEKYEMVLRDNTTGQLVTELAKRPVRRNTRRTYRVAASRG